MREQLQELLRASGIARRRAEEERAEAFFPLRATTKAADSSAMREQLQELLRASGMARDSRRFRLQHDEAGGNAPCLERA